MKLVFFAYQKYFMIHNWYGAVFNRDIAESYQQVLEQSNFILTVIFITLFSE